ncbi:hypothetical protein BAE44_0020507 [Dichanthelium oligosanthes]|uniref:Uncharacterized protein n=1 Tax=Dichanthelium oligosanthes TaxID=888268 RepID=A0A1E5V024_9POAL|nr:hypothetical protein BAE44_0020507 [Dichanthelium oligosanthes]
MGRTYFTRFYLADLSTFDLDEESPFGPMRYTDTDTETSTNEYGLIYRHSVGKWFKPSDSATYPLMSPSDHSINVYGTIIARDSLDYKCGPVRQG